MARKFNKNVRYQKKFFNIYHNVHKVPKQKMAIQHSGLDLKNFKKHLDTDPNMINRRMIKMSSGFFFTDLFEGLAEMDELFETMLGARREKNGTEEFSMFDDFEDSEGLKI